MPSILVPIALQVPRRKRNLVVWRAHYRVIADPVGVLTKEIVDTPPRVSPSRQFRNRPQFFFAAAARIIQFSVAGVADKREVARVEKHAVVGQLWSLITVTEAMRLVANLECQAQLIARRKRRFQLIDRIEIARLPAHQVEGAVEFHLRDRLHLVGDVYLLDSLRRLVLKFKVAVAREGAMNGVEVDVGVDRNHFRLREMFVPLEAALVVCLDRTLLLSW